MKRLLNLPFFLFLLSFLIAYSLLGQEVRTASSGDWNSPSTWSGSGAPSSNTVFVIPFGDTVTVNCNCGLYENSTIEIYGALEFPGGRKINLDEFGEVNVYSSGYMYGTNNGDKLLIGGTTVWTGNSPPITGPVTCDEAACYSNSVLPIELIEAKFSSENGEEIEVSWSTASEQNNEYFIVEYSDDFIEWKEAVRVMGAGNATTPRQYNSTLYLNEVFKNKTLYLRLSQVDFDGTTRIVFEESLLFVDRQEVDYSLYPNPASDYLLIAGDNENVGGLIFTSIQGDLVREIHLEQGFSRIYLKDYVTKGYYWVHIIGLEGEILASKKLSIID